MILLFEATRTCPDEVPPPRPPGCAAGRRPPSSLNRRKIDHLYRSGSPPPGRLDRVRPSRPLMRQDDPARSRDRPKSNVPIHGHEPQEIVDSMGMDRWDNDDAFQVARDLHGGPGVSAMQTSTTANCGLARAPMAALDALIETAWSFPSFRVSYGAFDGPPVSYTHLTLPTIYSV